MLRAIGFWGLRAWLLRAEDVHSQDSFFKGSWIARNSAKSVNMSQKFDVGVCLFFGKLLGLVKATQGHRRGLFVVVDDILLDGMKVGTR